MMEAADAVGGEDVYIETTTESYGERIKSSCGLTVLGILLFIGAFPFLYWNEGRAVDRYNALNEAEGQTTTVSSLSIDPSNEGKLLHFTADITNEGGLLTDPIFGATSDGLVLRRNVEMYQWVEKTKTTSKKNTGGSKTTTTEYSYHKEWRSKPVNSGSFKKPQGHTNPSMTYNGASWTANPINIGAYELPTSLTGRLSWSKSIPVPKLEDIIDPNVRAKAVVKGNEFYFASDIAPSPPTTPSTVNNYYPPSTPVSNSNPTNYVNSNNQVPVPATSGTNPSITTPKPTTSQPTTQKPTTPIPATSGTTPSITTPKPTTSQPSTQKPTPIPTQYPTTSKPTTGLVRPDIDSNGCVDTNNYLDMYGGSCAEYSQPGNEAWCDGYGALGAPGATPNENCCVCKSSNDEEEEIVLGGLRGRRRLQTLDSTYRYHFYPVAEQRSCLKNTNNNAPSYMYNAPQQYFFSSVEQCCSTSYATLTSDVDYCLKVSQAVVDVSASTGPRIGDQRVSFNETPESIITIVAVQAGNSLGAFVSETGEGGDILLFKQGTFTSAQMYEEAHLANQATTWIFRFLGWGAMGLGLYLLFRPLEVMSDVLPCVGSIIGCGITFMAVLISAILSTLTISIAWLAARPQIGAIVLCVLLAIIGACGFGFKKYRDKRKEEDDDSSSSSSSSSAKKDNGKEKTSDSTLEKNPLDLNGDGKVDEKDAKKAWKMSKTTKGKVELMSVVSSFAATKASKKRDGGDANCSAPEGGVPTVEATPEQTNGYPERPPLQGATSPPQPYVATTATPSPYVP